MSKEKNMLIEWEHDYIKNSQFENNVIVFGGYKELAIRDGFRMGRCECTWIESKKWIQATIYLDDDHTKCPTFFRDATLWHEFCHAWEACEMVHVDHCLEFQKRKWKKPVYVIGDIVLKLIGWMWFD